MRTIIIQLYALLSLSLSFMKVFLI